MCRVSPIAGDPVLPSDVCPILALDFAPGIVISLGQTSLGHAGTVFKRRQFGFVLGMVAQMCGELGAENMTQILSGRSDIQR